MNISHYFSYILKLNIQAYQVQQQLKRQLELDKIRAEEQKKREQQQLEVERLKKGFGKPHSTYRESNTSIGAILLSRLTKENWVTCCLGK